MADDAPKTDGPPRKPAVFEVRAHILGPEARPDHFSPRLVKHPLANTQQYQRQLIGKPPPEHVSHYGPRRHYPSDRRAETLHDKPAVYSSERLRMETWRSTVILSWMDGRRENAVAAHSMATQPGSQRTGARTGAPDSRLFDVFGVGPRRR